VEDRLTRGFIAGVVGGIGMNLWGFFAGLMNFTTLRMADWAVIMIYAHTPPFDSGEIIFALLGQLFFTGALGAAFVYLLRLVTSKNLIFKGWFFSVLIWFFIYAVTTLFKVEGTMPLPFKTAVANFIAATIYGLALPIALKILTVRLDSTQMSMAPAMKPLNKSEEDES